MSVEKMSLKEICACCTCCEGDDDASGKSKDAQLRRKSWKNYCTSGFLPECVRKTVATVKNNEKSKIPLGIRMSVVLLSCEIPAIPEVIDLYSISSSFSIIDVVDELNIHLTEIIKRMVTQGGDIISLEDDLVECIWSVEDDVNSVCSTALNTALSIQKESGVTHTKIGYDLKNKIGITLGDLDILFVGTEKVYYIATGEIQNEMKSTLKSHNTQTVVVTKAFWSNIVDTEKYHFNQLKDDFVEVYSTTERVPDMDAEEIEEKYAKMEQFEITIEDELVKYLHTFHKSAKTSQQLQILTSMSQVVFIAVRTIDLNLSSLELLQTATDLVLKIVEDLEGILTKIVNLRSPTLCIVFGFPGFKHKDDAIRGVLCAQRILKTLQELEIKVVIGISAGMLFCGVLGFQLRQECCVLGMAVHIALSIVNQMSSYQIVCCINTFFRTCRGLGEVFTPLRRKLKGVKSSNLFFQISTEEVKKFDSKERCVGRTEEKEMLGRALKEIKEGMQDLNSSLLPLINITGKLGIGKSSLLGWCMQEGRKLGYSLIARVDNSMFEAPNENSWMILKQILTSRHINNESKIMELLGPEATDYPLQLLNRRMNMSFSLPSLILKDECPRNMMLALIKKCHRGEPLLIGLDNAEHTGTESWLFLQCLLADRCACVVATFTEEFSTNVPFVRQLIHQQYLGVQLEPFLGNNLGALACHLLNVDAIHKGFLDFLQRKSGGNALYLREILMLPPLQKHFCIVPYISVTESTLQEKFVPAEEDVHLEPIAKKVCDILDSEGLQSVQIPKQLLDVFNDRSTALNPEEQMLMRKCSLLGDTFGLRILEALSPEFTTMELYDKVQELTEKKILMHLCEHCRVVESVDWRKISLKDVPLKYCVHPLRFASEFLKQCVVNSMADTQMRRMNLYLADLLVEEDSQTCDACRREIEARKTPSRNDLLKHYKIPNIDFRLCRCLNLKTDILIQAAFHLEKGKADIPKLIGILLKASETGLEAREVAKVEEILNKTKRLMNLYKSSTQPDHIEIAINRLRSKLKLRYGQVNDSLRTLKHAFLSMNVVFPNDLRKSKIKVLKGPLAEEEWKCQALGSLILLTLGEYEDACTVAEYNLTYLLELNAPVCPIIDAKASQLKALVRTPPTKNRERTVRKIMNEIKSMCFKRLSENPELNILELRTIIRSIIAVVQGLFEAAELDAGEELGSKLFQILKTINSPKQLARVCFLRALISYYGRDYKKCMEMLNELQDAHEQSGDQISQVLFYLMLIMVVREKDVISVGENEIKMVQEYANQETIISPHHPKHNHRLFCVSSAVALWCVENKLNENFAKWYDQAGKIKMDVDLNTYLTVLGSIYLMMIDISKIAEKSFIFTVGEIEDLKAEKFKSIEILQRQAKDYVPVLVKETKHLEKYLSESFKGCKVLKSHEKITLHPNEATII